MNLKEKEAARSGIAAVEAAGSNSKKLAAAIKKNCDTELEEVAGALDKCKVLDKVDDEVRKNKVALIVSQATKALRRGIQS